MNNGRNKFCKWNLSLKDRETSTTRHRKSLRTAWKHQVLQCLWCYRWGTQHANLIGGGQVHGGGCLVSTNLASECWGLNPSPAPKSRVRILTQCHHLNSEKIKIKTPPKVILGLQCMYCFFQQAKGPYLCIHQSSLTMGACRQGPQAAMDFVISGWTKTEAASVHHILFVSFCIYLWTNCMRGHSAQPINSIGFST